MFLVYSAIGLLENLVLNPFGVPASARLAVPTTWHFRQCTTFGFLFSSGGPEFCWQCPPIAILDSALLLVFLLAVPVINFVSSVARLCPFRPDSVLFGHTLSFLARLCPFWPMFWLESFLMGPAPLAYLASVLFNRVWFWPFGPPPGAQIAIVKCDVYNRSKLWPKALRRELLYLIKRISQPYTYHIYEGFYFAEWDSLEKSPLWQLNKHIGNLTAQF